MSKVGKKALSGGGTGGKKKGRRKSSPKQERYLVTGACGFMGSWLVDLAVEQRLSVRATDLPTADRRCIPERVEFVPADPAVPASLEGVFDGIDIVLHPAAVAGAGTGTARLRAMNEAWTANTCRAALQAGVRRLVTWSACGVRPSGDEMDVVDWRVMGDQGLAATIVRPGLVYGPRGRHGVGRLIEGLAMAPIVPIPVNLRNPLAVVHVRDVARAALFLARHKGAVEGDYTVVDSSDATVAELIRFGAATLNRPTFPAFVPSRLADLGGRAVGLLGGRGTMECFLADLHSDNRKLLDLGFTFEYPDFRKGIVETIDWFRREGIIAGV